MKPLLIDADSLIFRTTRFKEHEYYFAVRHVINLIEDIAEEVNPTGAIILCMSSPKSFRKKAVSSYKAQRKPPKFPLFKKIKKHLSNQSLIIPQLEADDLVVLLKKYFYPEGTICSIDKDILYGTPGTHFNYHHKHFSFVTTTKEDAKQFYYKQLLMGDNSDNIKGIPRVGEKTAQKLLNTWEFEQKNPLTEIELLYKEKDMLDDFKNNQLLLKMIDSKEELESIGLSLSLIEEHLNQYLWK
jgi:DNA polymerase-1